MVERIFTVVAVAASLAAMTIIMVTLAQSGASFAAPGSQRDAAAPAANVAPADAGRAESGESPDG